MHQFGFPLGKGRPPVETDHIVLIIVAVFAIAGLLLMFLRAFVHDLDSFMRDLF